MTTIPPVSDLPHLPNPQAGPAAEGYIDLTLQGNRFTASLFPPKVFVNDWLVPAPFGRSIVPIPAGPCRVEIYTYSAISRRSSLEFVLRPQQHVPVYYGPPFSFFAAGAIGHTRQSRPDWWLLAVVCGLLLLPWLAVFRGF